MRNDIIVSFDGFRVALPDESGESVDVDPIDGVSRVHTNSHLHAFEIVNDHELAADSVAGSNNKWQHVLPIVILY